MLSLNTMHVSQFLDVLMTKFGTHISCAEKSIQACMRQENIQNVKLICLRRPAQHNHTRRTYCVYWLGNPFSFRVGPLFSSPTIFLTQCWNYYSSRSVGAKVTTYVYTDIPKNLLVLRFTKSRFARGVAVQMKI